MNDLLNIDITTPMSVTLGILAIIGVVCIIIAIADIMYQRRDKECRDKLETEQEPISIPPNVAVNPSERNVYTIGEEKRAMATPKHKQGVGEQDK